MQMTGTGKKLKCIREYNWKKKWLYLNTSQVNDTKNMAQFQYEHLPGRLVSMERSRSHTYIITH